MIPVQTIVDRCNFALDAEGSGRYLFEQDFKPAINSSIEWLVAVFNRVFAEKKLSEENLRELIKTRVFLASAFSRLNLDKDSLDGDSLWTILRVMPSPRVYPEFDESSIEGCDKKSKLMDELLYVGSSKSFTIYRNHGSKPWKFTIRGFADKGCTQKIPTAYARVEFFPEEGEKEMTEDEEYNQLVIDTRYEQLVEEYIDIEQAAVAEGITPSERGDLLYRLTDLKREIIVLKEYIQE